MLVYAHGAIQEEQTPRLPEEGELVWLHLDCPTDENLKHALTEVFACHPLLVEDTLHFGQRPKLDHYPGPRVAHDVLFFYALRPNFKHQEFCIIMSDQFIVTVTKTHIVELEKVYESVSLHPELMATPGTLVYRLLDACVDEYFTVIDSLEEHLDDLQERVFEHSEQNNGRVIFQLKRHVQTLRRLASDGRNVIGILSHTSFPYTEESHTVYFVDLYDHIARVVDSLDAARDNLNGLLDLQTAQRANRMNEVMKTLTIISTIFLPLSFIVGLYGMNVKGVPEYTWPFGYEYVWALLITVTTVFIIYLKKKKWF